MSKFDRVFSPAIKLTVAYTAIIMVLSLSFSSVIYTISARQIDMTVRRQVERINRSTNSNVGQPPAPLGQIEADLANALTQLQLTLVFFNLIILTLASIISYILAKRTLKPIEDALNIQSRFTANASHELRTPLASMQTEIEVALRSKSLGKSEAMALLDSNLEEVKKLTELSNRLLALSQSGAKPLERSLTTSKKIEESTLKFMKKTIGQKNATVEFVVDDFELVANTDAFTELLSILIDNAIKYGDIKQPIVVTAKKYHGQAIFEVTNNGVGIAAADLPYIFDRFYRADTVRTTSKKSGYGLGLSLAREIANAHQAKLSVKSRPGKTTTFTIAMYL